MAAVLVVLALGCGRDGGKLVVLGVDGLYAPLVESLARAGTLPHFRRLYRDGCTGVVTTGETGMPPLSPRVWNTFATGQLPDRHGITHFVAEGGNGKRLYSSRDRQVPAVWEIASASGRRVGVVNWLTTYPAEHVNGFVVSERYLPLPAQTLAGSVGVALEREARGLVYPPALFETLGKLHLPPQTTLASSAELADKIDREIFTIARTALAIHPVDLLLIYTRSMDELSHLYWHTHAPLPGEPPPPRDEVVEFMRRYDVMLGELLAGLGPADRLVVLSDHGMERNREKGALTGRHASRLSARGVLILYGAGIPRCRAAVVSALDIAPTILALLGLPADGSMTGHVIAAAFPPGVVPPAKRSEPYARLPTADGDGASPADAAMIERLKTLGYVQ
jgi:predicted AlkP superfamily phosphohydrolase/phosphomutase